MAYRQPGGWGILLTEGVKYLLIWNAILFLLQHYVLANTFGFLGWEPIVRVRVSGLVQELRYPLVEFTRLFGLIPAVVWQKFTLWQLVSYMFLHGGLTHILLNMFMLWMFGGELERLWGTRRFLTYYFFTGIGAGVLSVVATPLSPIPIVGASGAIYGILLAYGYHFPERRIFLYFLFPVPARVFVIFLGVMAFLGSWGSSGGIAHITHLGGLVFGFIFLRATRPGGFFGGGRRRSARIYDFTDRDRGAWRG